VTCPKCSTLTMDVMHTNEAQCDLIHAKKRIQALEEALRNLADKLDAAQPEIEKVTMLAWAHGNRYDGPNYREELRRAKEALDHEW